ncbi:MAG: hypothetical protein JXA46_18360 [Dehalococcoidales bacterium]|nr:hypothetical protein [Dehalococcoidales bacterium]
MGTEYIFYDYIDDNGSNVINAWLNGGGRQTKSFFNHTINYLEASPPPRTQDSVWGHPYTKTLKGQWGGFFELRKTGRIQYRLIGKIEECEVFLVATGYPKGSWKTDITPQTAKERIIQMKDNPAKYRREHDHS